VGGKTVYKNLISDMVLANEKDAMVVIQRHEISENVVKSILK
jgi:hypothetical protein